MKSTLKTISLALALLLVLPSCSVTRIVVENDCDSLDNLPDNQKTTCSLFWGLMQPKDIKPECCETCAMNKVEVINRLDHTLITLITLGIVIPQQIKWCCAPIDIGPGNTN